MDLLNLDDSRFSQAPRESFTDVDLYMPDPAKGQQGIYKGVGRFLPWHKNTNESKYRKNVGMLTNPLSKDRLVLDCPSTIPGKPSVLWALDKLLKDREQNKMDEDLTKEIRQYFSRFLNFYSPFYIFKDPQVPALENQIKIFQFGITLDKKIQAQLNPEDLELNPNAKKINPYSLLAGKDFLIVVKKKSKKYKDYDDCKFLDDVVPFRFNIGGEKHIVSLEELQQTSAGQETPISKFLSENTPNMEKYYYREWTEDNYKQVASYLKAIIPYAGFMRELIDSTREEKMKQLLIDVTSGNYGTASTPPASTPAPAANTPAPGMNLLDNTPAHTPAPVAEQPVTAGQAPAAATPAAPAAAAPNEDNEFDKMLKGL